MPSVSVGVSSKTTNDSYQWASEEERQAYVDQASVWFNCKNPSQMFSSTRSTAIAAVAEYMANLDGYTLFGK